MANAEDRRSDVDKGQPAFPAALSIDGHKQTTPELLAPAGEPESVYAAFSAGADAVYLGAERFSARAYARNFNEEELLKALDHAHLFGKKIYLTCNILMRKSEADEIYDILDPLYEHGLDGVIVQDIGLLSCLNKRYPLLPLHGSTQMSVNSVSGAKWLMRHGVCRVVPGRELSLEEIRQIKECGIEVECFVHGAMCYSYSGKCLLSSLAGGRSGNRGRCAGPCRQLYSVNGGKSAYYLSMKDMMALESIGGLIDAGVDSFKIEGRLKAPEYSAGVSAIYRKYIDMYLEGKDLKPAKEDLKALSELYMRSERQEGYLHKHNGRDMISLDSPAYSKVSEERKALIREAYIEKPLKKAIEAEAFIRSGNEIKLVLNCEGKSVCVSGEKADKAQKRPLSDEDIRKQLSKTGDTDYIIKDLKIDNDGGSFVPVSALNALRRDAFDTLTAEILPHNTLDRTIKAQTGVERINRNTPSLKIGICGNADIKELSALKETEGFILDLDAFIKKADRYTEDAKDKEIFIRMPSVLRQKDISRVSGYIKTAAGYDIKGFYCGCLDAVELVREYAPQIPVLGDQGLYVFNPYTEDVVLNELSAYTISHEFSAAQIKGAIRKDAAELIVYGRIPVMYSANCVIKTAAGCDKRSGWTVLTDEKDHSFPVRPVHEYCYNIMYNCVPVSLHRETGSLYSSSGLSALRLEFTDESPARQLEISRAFIGIINGEDTGFPIEPGLSSRGHYKRGVE